MTMLDDDDDFGGGDGNDASFGGGDGDGGGFGDGMSSYSPTDSLEDSGNYVGYLAWSDEKVQRVLNSTRMHFYNFAHTWNKTFAPVQMHAMEDTIWRLKHAFGDKVTMCVCVRACVRARARSRGMCMCVCARARACIFVCMYIFTHISKYIHVHTHVSIFIYTSTLIGKRSDSGPLLLY
jgi:hypothetical protein